MESAAERNEPAASRTAVKRRTSETNSLENANPRSRECDLDVPLPRPSSDVPDGARTQMGLFLSTR